MRAFTCLTGHESYKRVENVINYEAVIIITKEKVKCKTFSKKKLEINLNILYFLIIREIV